MTLYRTACVPFVRTGWVVCAVGAMAGIAPAIPPAIASEQSAGEQVEGEQGASPAQEQAVDAVQDLQHRLLDEHTRTRIKTPPLLPKPVGINRPLKPKRYSADWGGPPPYPAGPLRDGIEGTVGFTLQVDANGRPTDCAVTSSSGNVELDAFACSTLMKRAKFDPKLVDGVPVPSTYSTSVRWVLPQNREPVTTSPYARKSLPVRDRQRSAAIPIANGMNRPVKPRGNPAQWIKDGDYPMAAYPVEGMEGFTLQVSADGRPMGCKITASSGSPDLDAATCPAMMKRARFDPKLVDGQPVPSTYSNRIRWSTSK